MAYLIMCKKTKQCVAVYQNKETLKGLNTDKFDFIDEVELEKAKRRAQEKGNKATEKGFRKAQTTTTDSFAASGFYGSSYSSYSTNGSSSSCDSSSSGSSDSGGCY